MKKFIVLLNPNLIFLFESEDKNIKKKALDNINISQKKNSKLSESIKVNAKCLISEFFILNKNNIKSRKSTKKGKYSNPCTVIGNNDDNDYKITKPINYKT